MQQPISDDSAALDRSIGHLTSALGDPTRRAIFIAVRESPEPMTSSAVSELFGIHSNVARHHLDKLANDGYLQVTHRRPSGRSGPGAGRPAKCYEASGKPIDLHFPAQRHDLLIELLLRVLERTGVEELATIAETVGREYGEELAGEIGEPGETGYEEAVTAVATAMTGLGFRMSPDVDGQRLLTSGCPFGSSASDHPEVVCSLDRGVVGGLFGELGPACHPVLHPSPEAEECVTEVPVSISS